MAHPFLPQQSASVSPGKTALCRIDGETVLSACVTPDTTRRVLPDATGRYVLHVDAADKNPPLILHLNQAGWALVGWISPTPPFVPSQANVPEGCVTTAVLVADLDPSAVGPISTANGAPSGSRLVYKDVDAIADHDPSDILDPESPFPRGKTLWVQIHDRSLGAHHAAAFAS